MLYLNMKVRIILFLLTILVVVGCTSYEEYARERSEKLLKIYPPGTTTREAVQKKWGKIQPDFSAVRPDSGWERYENPYIRSKIIVIEKKIGREVTRIDRYWGPDGFMSLCYCWFYYDSTDYLRDAEWQYKSD